GSIGHINFSAGQADWNILIRTMEAHSGPIEWFATVQAGGGVVFDSSPAAEVEEARWKAAAVAEATWGFKTGFNSGELPEGEVGILPLPVVEGALGRISPSEVEVNDKFNNSRVLIVDNLDSFTNNIAEMLHRQGASVSVVEGRPVNEDNSASTVDEWLRKYRPTHIILGPGPSRPEISLRTMEIAKRAIEGRLTNEGLHIPLLGWCLGHQAIGKAAGWNLVESPLGAIHGVPSIIHHDSSGLYEELESEIILMRYNSLVLESTNTILSANAWDYTNQLIMGLHHRTLPIHGVQFHPESVGSPDGIALLTSFLSLPVVKVQPVSDSQQARQP
ncbi:MAG TPA: chorismate-binding protein, partial [Candidatus Thalassarchaeaceae archaeon]|nr:chorismate-binding protein [Candidatus Thalassarchaeaceae archaeon]